MQQFLQDQGGAHPDKTKKLGTSRIANAKVEMLK